MSERPYCSPVYMREFEDMLDYQVNVVRNRISEVQDQLTGTQLAEEYGHETRLQKSKQISVLDVGCSYGSCLLYS